MEPLCIKRLYLHTFLLGMSNHAISEHLSLIPLLHGPVQLMGIQHVDHIIYEDI